MSHISWSSQCLLVEYLRLSSYQRRRWISQFEDFPAVKQAMDFSGPQAAQHVCHWIVCLVGFPFSILITLPMFDSPNLNILYDTYYIMLYLMAGNLEVKLPSNGQSGANSEKKKFSTKKIREEKESGKIEQEERRSTCEKRCKNARHSVFPMFCGSGWSKSRLAKAAGGELSCQMKIKKLHAAVARSTCRNQHV